MKPPRRIRVGHIDFTVVVDADQVDRIAEDTDADGCMSEKHALIAIRPLPEPRTRTVLVHELIHGCIAASGLVLDDEVEERFVAAATGPLLAALRDNKFLVQFLTA